MNPFWSQGPQSVIDVLLGSTPRRFYRLNTAVLRTKPLTHDSLWDTLRAYLNHSMILMIKRIITLTWLFQVPESKQSMVF